MQKSWVVSRWWVSLLGVHLSGPLAAAERAPTFDNILPGSAIVDARSVLDAARMDRLHSSSGAQAQCLDEATGGAASAPVAENGKPNRFAAMVGKLTERTQIVNDADRRAQLSQCTQTRRAAFAPQLGLEHFAKLVPGNTMRLTALAVSASGVEVDGTPLPSGKASPTCVRSMHLPGPSWRTFSGVLTPTVEQVPPMAGIEASVSVIDQACYRKTFSNAPIPADVEVLTVQQYLDRVVDHRVARLRTAGYGPYASALNDEYLRLKANKN